ncbi:hypothetical protein K437DRAFT_256912 [Tilletiaria anomala UBC 951]|uniref:Adenylyl cyclase-associated protein n=1 Tax=Tilletiaria anomala (strain ATCC 24038 / CBS 436.72 / UBC 951) TaxID=1037660 RepID=A0A066VT82_TILAU|nr:uncharacterized protein K437DRAFT_256912 [Tilletiaria anomala UBC 951]KDN44681.1 hypothetical protein K437DRAFT_256912 [Tilletiaria anomala UBC 951]
MAATSGIANLSTLTQRLEAATSRLEDLAQIHGDRLLGGALCALGVAGTAVAGGVPQPPPFPPSAPTAEELPPAVEAWDEQITPALSAYTSLSFQLGDLIADQAKSVQEAFEAQRHIVLLAASSAKPGNGGLQSPTFAKIVEPLQKALMAVTEIREKNRAQKKIFNHLSAVSEGIPAAGWVAIEPKPAPFVGEMKDSAQFYLNRVINDFKNQDKTHVEWCRSVSKLLQTLQDYVEDKHTVGLMWNPKGGDAASFAGRPPGTPPAPPAAPPAPAPPSMLAGGGMEAVFGQLNQGEGITKSLKKVDPSQMTHKNPSLRTKDEPVATSPKSSGPPKIPSKPESLRTKKPAKTQLDGTKWMIENYEDNRSIVIEQTEISHTVNIFNCKNSIIQIKGKVNAVSMVSCSKTSVLVDSLVSSLSVTSSPSFVVQVTGKVPTVLIDATDSGLLYLSKESLDAEIITAKCSAINISVPLQGGEDGEFIEHALPEQMKHTFQQDGKFKTEIIAHTG